MGFEDQDPAYEVLLMKELGRTETKRKKQQDYLLTDNNHENRIHFQRTSSAKTQRCKSQLKKKKEPKNGKWKPYDRLLSRLNYHFIKIQ